MTWFCVFTQPNKEFTASEHLERQGYETYLPTFRRWVKHARVKAYVPRPLFPRYLFVAFDFEEKPVHPIRSTYGVRWLVGQGSEPLPIDDSVINQLRDAGEASIFDEPASTSPRWLKPGAMVRITEGCFQGFVGELLGKTDKGRVNVLLNLFGSAWPAAIPVAQLESASP